MVTKVGEVETTVEDPTEIALDEFVLDPEATQEVTDLLKGTEEPKVEEPKVEKKTPAEAGLTAALVAERSKRATATDRWKKVQEERDRLQSQLNARTTLPVLTDFALDLTLTPEELKGISESADKQETFGGVAQETATRVAQALGGKAKKQMGEALTRLSKQVSDSLFETRMNSLEGLARIRHRDYDVRIKDSAIFAGLAINPQTGRAVDEVLARDVFGSADPAEKLYELATGKLVAEGKLPEDASDISGEPIEIEPAKPAAVAKPVEAPPKDVREAERRIIDKVVTNGGRPKGISQVPSAAPSRSGGVTREQIDRLSDNDYASLMAKRPDLREWYLAGRQ